MTVLRIEDMIEISFGREPKFSQIAGEKIKYTKHQKIMPWFQSVRVVVARGNTEYHWIFMRSVSPFCGLADKNLRGRSPKIE
jgi:hypothetical protein